MVKFKLTHNKQVIEFASLQEAEAYLASHGLNTEIVQFYEELPEEV